MTEWQTIHVESSSCWKNFSHGIRHFTSALDDEDIVILDEFRGTSRHFDYEDDGYDPHDWMENILFTYRPENNYDYEVECRGVVLFEGKVKTNICQLKPGLVIFGGVVMECGYGDK